MQPNSQDRRMMRRFDFRLLYPPSSDSKARTKFTPKPERQRPRGILLP